LSFVDHLEVHGGIGVQILGGEPEQPTLPWRAVGSDPDIFVLFDWRSRVAPLCGRNEEVSDLLHWASEGRGSRVRFLTGAGGTGKSRLAAEVAQRLRDLGWDAGFVPLEGNPLEALGTRGRFLIVDYPEDKRPRISELFKKLSMREDADVPIRVLLLSREPFAKWQREVDATSVTQLCDAREISLSALGAPRAIDLCRGVWKQLEIYAVPGIQIPGISDEAITAWVTKDDQLHGCPLFLVAAALHSALESGRTFELSGVEVVKALVRRECARLDRANLGGFSPEALARLMALSFIGGGLAPATLRDLADPALEVGIPSRESVVDPLRRTPWWRDGKFAAPSPDILAAALAHQVLAETEEDDRVSEWLWPVMRDAVGSESSEQVLGRIDRADYDIHSIFGWGSSRLSKWLEGIVQGKGSVVRIERASALEPIVYSSPHAGSLLVVKAVVEVLAMSAPTGSDRRAGLMSNLGKILGNLGRREDALRATEAAVTVYQQLAEAHPAANLSNLASNLNGLGIRLGELGRREEALRATEAAVAIYRQLVESHPESHSSELAASLNNLGIGLRALGRREDALRATEEALGIYQQMPVAQREAHKPFLAVSMNNLGEMLGDLGRRDEALRVTEKAVDMYQQLENAQPQAFSSGAARSLNNLGIRLDEMGRHEDALHATKTAAAMYRQLEKAQPDAFLPYLAGSLSNLGKMLGEMGQLEEAFRATDEAVEKYRELVKLQPNAFLPDLARSMSNLGIRLGKLGRQEEALRTTEAAVLLWRQLVKSQPDAFLPDLAKGLSNLGSMPGGEGRQDEAIRSSKEAVRIYRQLAKAQPDAFLPDFATSLSNLGTSLSEVGQRGEALLVVEEAVEIRRRLAKSQPETFLPVLARGLTILGIMLSRIGRREEAMRATDEAVSIRRHLGLAK